MNCATPSVGLLFLQNTAKQLPAFTKCIETLLADYPQGLDVRNLHSLYCEHRSGDSPELELDPFIFALGTSWGTYRTIVRTTNNPLIFILSTYTEVEVRRKA